MKYVKILFAITVVFAVCSAFSMKKDHPKSVYAFGVAASFTDTIVYFTDIQMLDSVKLSKEGFLPHRDQYSYQLRNYLEYGQLQQNSTCMIYFSDNLKKLEKEAAKILGKYRKSKNLVVQKIEPDKFRFKKPEDENQ
ncbi:hypothetical protein [Bacteroides sp.]|uniref:hypothetical protein n=1 Tax=Bacteroides sp. TaxID=29523 RepID=UPI00260DD751|nr:hypothetical protein [Bacteroides sp.]MDD3040699.1 hypothetical protein [Bacteroides sp.]